MIVLVFTGGTIAMRHDPSAGGAIPLLRGREILDRAPGIESLATLQIDEWGSYPGPHMTVDRMWQLRENLAQHVARPDVDGVVVTHGTDSLEETAYLVARSIDSPKPIVFTGAVRTSSELGWDGPGNLAGAVRLAASGRANGYGVMVVMADRIYTALDVTKSHTSSIDAFESPGYGPIGVIDDGLVVLRHVPSGGSLLPPASPRSLATPVDIVYAYAGSDARLLDAVRSDGRGLVIAGMGRGNVPPEMVPGIERWLAEGKPVVMTSRAARGRVGRTYGYAGGGRRLWERGVIFAAGRRPSQARIDLMLGLGAGLSVDELRDLFERP